MKRYHKIRKHHKKHIKKHLSLLEVLRLYAGYPVGV